MPPSACSFRTEWSGFMLYLLRIKQNVPAHTRWIYAPARAQLWEWTPPSQNYTRRSRVPTNIWKNSLNKASGVGLIVRFSSFICVRESLLQSGRFKELFIWNSRSKLHAEAPGLLLKKGVAANWVHPPPPTSCPLHKVLFFLPGFVFSSQRFSPVRSGLLLPHSIKTAWLLPPHPHSFIISC